MKWISVDKRLPPQHEDVLVYEKRENKVLIGCLQMDSSYDGDNYWIDSNFNRLYVTDWMPLPKRAYFIEGEDNE